MSLVYALRIPEAIVARIRKMHPRLKRKIRAALNDIIRNPESGKALKLELTGLRSYRVGRFRVIYRIDPEKTIALVAVGPRKVIYVETYRLILEGKSFGG